MTSRTRTDTGPEFRIPMLARALEPDVRRKIDTRTKPVGALGRLEALALQVCLIQETMTPRLQAPRILLFAGDHGAVAEGISAYPQDVTWQMVQNFLHGGAAINVFARQNGMAVEVVDAGVNHDFAPHPALHAAKVAYGTANYVREPAMTMEQCLDAVERGAQIARSCAAAGTNVIACGEMGIGNTGAASLLLHRLVGADLDDCVGRGAGLDLAGMERKLAVLDAASRRCPGYLAPMVALRQYGGFEIAMMVGAFLAAAESRMVILVDGFIASAALLVAARMQPQVLDYCVFAHCSAEPGHRILLKTLHATPLLTLDMRLGEGTGAAVAYPLLQAAVNFLNEMASFSDAGIAGKS